VTNSEVNLDASVYEKTLDLVARNCDDSCTFDNKDLRSKITKDILSSCCKNRSVIMVED